MTIKKDEAIQGIFNDFEKLANVVLEQLDNMEHIITSGELNISDEMLAQLNKNEESINQLEVKISDKIVNTIVLQNPFASELRKLMSCYRILINLERIGDRVINVSNFIKKIKTPELYDSFHEIFSNTAILSVEMVRKSLWAFSNNDIEFAIWTIKNDDVMDEVNSKLLKKLVKKTNSAETDKHLLTSMVTLKEMMSNLERIGDYATNIAEATIYAVEGKDIRHHNIEE
ncbi:phosphate signaling complex PhoU family protein [Mangrovibacterium diazotrophicum]|uniref:Phosphate transport system protein n=1 Tax=Mangrovibacterium diazotrophicum TaxID=1261403 RepID=A0A419W9T7_9BACT|nr:PhoU domain-containing protein [Mangrovibacterium diazotrophicum]RKD92172.1 phosphate transport system protein [Mangrovibacterium diazotrophicum]